MPGGSPGQNLTREVRLLTRPDAISGSRAGRGKGVDAGPDSPAPPLAAGA